MSKETDEFSTISAKLEGLQDILDKLYDASKSVDEFSTMKRRFKKKIQNGYQQSALAISRATSDFISAHLEIHKQDVKDERKELRERVEEEIPYKRTILQKMREALSTRRRRQVEIIRPDDAKRLEQAVSSCPGQETNSTELNEVSSGDEDTEETQKANGEDEEPACRRVSS